MGLRMATEYTSTTMETFIKVTGQKMNKMVRNYIILGQGTYRFSNGSLYIGNFKNGQPHG